jgi:hypothetical protein
MPWLTDLVVPVRNSGIPYSEVSGWQNRGHGGMSGVKSVAVHHTAGPPSGDCPSLNVCTYGREGLDGPLCQLFLCRSGHCHIVAAGLAYHAGEVKNSAYSNAWSVGIEAEATGVSPWPQPQYDNYAKLCESLCDHYRITTADIVLGHKEICSPSGRKIDPNFDMHSFRALCDTIQLGADMDQAQDERLKRVEIAVEQILKQLCGPTATILEPFPKGGGWESWRYGDGGKTKATLVDYIRALDQQLLSAFNLEGRPGEPTDSAVGHVLSARREMQLAIEQMS